MTCFKYSSELIYEKYKNLIIHDFEVILKLWDNVLQIGIQQKV